MSAFQNTTAIPSRQCHLTWFQYAQDNSLWQCLPLCLSSRDLWSPTSKSLKKATAMSFGNSDIVDLGQLDLAIFVAHIIINLGQGGGENAYAQ